METPSNSERESERMNLGERWIPFNCGQTEKAISHAQRLPLRLI